MIRKATIENIPAIMEMAGRVFPATYKNILSTDQIVYMMNIMYSELSLTNQMTIEGSTYYLSEGRGYVSYRFDSSSEEYGDVFHLEKLYVLPEFQSTGLGRKLFETVVCAARDRSFGKFRIELNVNRSNKALSFYEHIGMHRDRQGDFPIGGGFFMNDWIMAADYSERQ